MPVGFAFDASIPVVSLDGTYQPWGLATELPVLQMEASFKSGWQFNATIPTARLSSAWGRPWSLDGRLPVAVMSSAFYPQIDWSLEAELPIVAMDAFYYVVDLTTQTAFCVNPTTQAHAEYTNFLFNSFCEFNGVYLGMSDAGVFTLAGEDDAGTPIDASCRFGAIDEDSSKKKRVDSAYLNLRHDGEIRVLMKYDEMDEYISILDYDGTVDPVGIHTRRAKFSRGAEGRNLQLGVENVSGADFEITDIEVVTVILSRS